MSFGKDLGEVSGRAVSTSKNLRFTLGPYLPPLTTTPDPKNQPEYAGQGATGTTRRLKTCNRHSGVGAVQADEHTGAVTRVPQGLQPGLECTGEVNGAQLS
jgi:hypothetical protein